MVNNKNTVRILVIAISFLFIIGMIFATMYDFQISAFLTKMQESEESVTMSFPIPSLIVEIVGEWPASIFGAFCLAIILRSLLKYKKPATYAGAAVSAVMIFYVMYTTCENTIEDVNFLVSDQRVFHTSNLLIAIPLTIITSLAIIAVALMMAQKTSDRLFVPAIVCAAMLLCLLLGTNIIKVVWGRVRMRELFEACDFSGFTKWFVPNFFSGSKSFPSGHTANAVSLALIPIFYSNKLKKRIPYLQVITYVLVAVWSVLVAFTRITVGAHYLSDVLFGGMIAFVAVMLGHYFMKRIREADPA